jgi:hypothetical protein
MTALHLGSLPLSFSSRRCLAALNSGAGRQVVGHLLQVATGGCRSQVTEYKQYIRRVKVYGIYYVLVITVRSIRRSHEAPAKTKVGRKW